MGDEMDIKEILEKHLLWLKGGDGGERASLSHASLRYASLRYANLSGADLGNANLSYANLSGADLSGADLRGANMDMSSGIPFHCGGTKFKGDDRLAAQMIYHFTRGDWDGCSGGVREAVEAVRSMAIADLFCEYRSDIK